MTSPAEPQMADAKALLLDRLRLRYRDQGYEFIPNPGPTERPGFLEDDRIDAIARRPGDNVVVEVRDTEASLRDRTSIRVGEKFAGQPGWRLHVVYANAARPAAAIPATTTGAVRGRLSEVADLRDAGHVRAAFLLAWSLLEAALNAIGGAATNRPRTPEAVVEALAMAGHLGLEIEGQLRSSVSLRNRLVHGDLSREPSTADVDLVLSAVHEALNPVPA